MPSTVGVEVPLESLPERPGWRTGRACREGKDTTDHGNCYLARVLGEIAIDAARTDSFLAERDQLAATYHRAQTPKARSRASLKGEIP